MHGRATIPCTLRWPPCSPASPSPPPSEWRARLDQPEVEEKACHPRSPRLRAKAA